ncbi:MAG: Na+/H+ antiporter NhaA [Saprospiraceae bacterium]
MATRLTTLFKEFFASERTGGILLLVCTAFSLLLANSAWSAAYLHFWHREISNFTLEHWINDGLMAIFFLLIGLELEREIYIGELSSARSAILPAISALGGMVVPALFHFAFNNNTPTQGGTGIPMATDIAFALGILALLGRRIPASLKIFLTALAVIDDLGAILIIAIFYSAGISWFNLGVVGGIMLFLFILNRIKVYNLIPYLVGGVIMWYFMLHSGIHATIIGILLAFVIPFGSGDERSPSYILQHLLHYPVAFIILPLFALANTAIPIAADWYTSFYTSNSLGIISGLVLGKPLGIFLFCWLAVAVGITQLPEDLKWTHIIGAGLLAGIGFTMSIFITLLAFHDINIINESKIAILAASLIAGLLGLLWLRFIAPATVLEEIE